MATTYTLISSNVLSVDTASITFSSIPSTYTDLVVRCSVRTDETGGTTSLLNMRINSTTLNYSNTELRGDGSAASSTAQSAGTSTRIRYVNQDGSTANTYANVELYIPSYTASQNKPFSAFAAQEQNSATAGAAWVVTEAQLWRDTTAVSSLQFYNTSGFNLRSGSSFYLYGIKNS